MVDESPKEYFEEKGKNLSVINLLPRNIKILIVITLVFIIYLILSTQKIPNTQEVCDLNSLNCSDRLVDVGGGVIKCCHNSLVYSSEALVPKKNIGWGRGSILIALYILTIFMILNVVAKHRILNIQEALDITEDYLKTNHSDYYYEKGPVCKMRFFLGTEKPFKWVIAVKMHKQQQVPQYYQAEILALWMSQRKKDHFIGLKKRDTELKADVEDKVDSADILYVYDHSLTQERMVNEALRRKTGSKSF